MAMKSKLKRAGWLSIALLFVVTGLVTGVYGFWQFTHPSDDPAAVASCSISQVPGEALGEPEAFKAESDVKRLEVTDLEEGSGAAVKKGDCLTVKYHGTFASSGEKFDGNFDTPLALKLPIGTGQVIRGWDSGMVGMKAGGLRRLVIPSDFAYGPNPPEGIPPDSDLVFVVKLISVQ